MHLYSTLQSLVITRACHANEMVTQTQRTAASVDVLMAGVEHGVTSSHHSHPVHLISSCRQFYAVINGTIAIAVCLSDN